MTLSQSNFIIFQNTPGLVDHFCEMNVRASEEVGASWWPSERYVCVVSCVVVLCGVVPCAVVLCGVVHVYMCMDCVFFLFIPFFVFGVVFVLLLFFFLGFLLLFICLSTRPPACLSACLPVCV